MKLENFARTTGRSWEKWLEFLNEIGAGELTHTEIAQRIHDTGDATGWWSQSIAVAYEQHIGRRVPGQVREGEYVVSASKSLPGNMDGVLKSWIEFMRPRGELGGVAISRGPEHVATEKWRYWRCGLADGSRVSVTIYQKHPGKAVLSVEHEKLETPDRIEHWRSFWKPLLKEFN